MPYFAAASCHCCSRLSCSSSHSTPMTPVRSQFAPASRSSSMPFFPSGVTESGGGGMMNRIGNCRSPSTIVTWLSSKETFEPAKEGLTTESTESTENTKSKSVFILILPLCPLCPLWLPYLRLMRYTCTSKGPNQSVSVPSTMFTVRGDSYITSATSATPGGRFSNFTCIASPSRLHASRKISSPTSRTRNSTPLAGANSTPTCLARSVSSELRATSAGCSSLLSPISVTMRFSTFSQNVQFQPSSLSRGDHACGLWPPK